MLQTYDVPVQVLLSRGVVVSCCHGLAYILMVMRGTRQNRVPEVGRHVLFAIVCAILLLIGTTIQQTHFHADGLTHADCTICHTAHQVVQPSAECAVQQSALPTTTTRVVLLSVRLPREHLFSFSHWNRPPPDQTAIA